MNEINTTALDLEQAKNKNLTLNNILKLTINVDRNLIEDVTNI